MAAPRRRAPRSRREIAKREGYQLPGGKHHLVEWWVARHIESADVELNMIGHGESRQNTIVDGSLDGEKKLVKPLKLIALLWSLPIALHAAADLPPGN